MGILRPQDRFTKKLKKKLIYNKVVAPLVMNYSILKLNLQVISALIFLTQERSNESVLRSDRSVMQPVTCSWILIQRNLSASHLKNNTEGT